MGPRRAKPNNSADVYFQSSTTTRDGPLTTVQNLSLRIFTLEKLFTDEVATYLSVTAGIHSQYFPYTAKFVSLKLVSRKL